MLRTVARSSQITYLVWFYCYLIQHLDLSLKKVVPLFVVALVAHSSLNFKD